MMSDSQEVSQGKLYRKSDVQKVADIILKARPGFQPRLGMIIGTGFAGFTETITDQMVFPYANLPLFAAELQTPGHITELVIGKINGQDIILVRGKMFLLDGVTPQQVALPVRLFHLLGVETLVYTNTAGAVNPAYKPGEFVFVKNHINLMARNPLVGEKNGEWGEMFFDMTYPYDDTLRELGKQTAAELGFSVQEGVYAGLLGPNFETASEIKMLSIIGADLVGMSTIMEVVAARQLGMKVLCLSFISNMAAGVLGQSLTNDEVLDTTRKHTENYARLMTRIFSNLTGSINSNK
jgi:purine-nucleoside phosphorylase